LKITTLISTSQLAEHLNDPDWLIADCRFNLADTEKGRCDYLVNHIAGAVYVHLDDDLSGPKIPGVTRRHPLPAIAKAAHIFSGLGIDSNVQVVAYDDVGGSLAAVRLWWMLRWLGHDKAAVLDGGWQKWQAEGRLVSNLPTTRSVRSFIPKAHPEKIATVNDVENIRLDPSYLLVDARAAERFRGMNEVIDPVAGHIPGAVSAPYLNNLNEDFTFRSTEILRSSYSTLLGSIPAERVVFYCGSGVTSIHSILAMVHAGFSEPRLYAGSWSEWITDSDRPIAVGA